MSSTPASKAASLLFRSPRRVRPNNRQARAAAGPGADRLHDLVGMHVHVKNEQMGLPFAEQSYGLGGCRDDLRRVEAMVERELDELDRDRSVEHQQHAHRSAAWLSRHLESGAVVRVRHERSLPKYKKRLRLFEATAPGFASCSPRFSPD